MALPEGQHALIDAVELGLGHGLVDGAPLHRGIGDFVANDVLILGGTAGKLAGSHHQCSVGGKASLAPLNGMLQKLRGAEIPVGRIQVVQSVDFEAEAAGSIARVGNRCSFF